MAAAIGGGPAARRRTASRSSAPNESFDDSVLNARGARSAVGQLADGRILLVTVEGGSSAYSAGMTNYELAGAMARLGAVTAMGARQRHAGGHGLRRHAAHAPRRRRSRRSPTRSLLSYNGVYAAPPSARRRLAERRRRRRHGDVLVQARAPVAGDGDARPAPSGAQLTLAQDAEQPGLHTVTWNGQPSTRRRSGSSPSPPPTTRAARRRRERDVPRSTTRSAALQASPASRARSTPDSTASSPRPSSSSHPATVTATIETRTGHRPRDAASTRSCSRARSRSSGTAGCGRARSRSRAPTRCTSSRRTRSAPSRSSAPFVARR